MPFVFFAQSAANAAEEASITRSNLATSALLDIGADPLDT
jgi:hypothetical protein